MSWTGVYFVMSPPPIPIGYPSSLILASTAGKFLSTWSLNFFFRYRRMRLKKKTILAHFFFLVQDDACPFKKIYYLFILRVWLKLVENCTSRQFSRCRPNWKPSVYRTCPRRSETTAVSSPLIFYAFHVRKAHAWIVVQWFKSAYPSKFALAPKSIQVFKKTRIRAAFKIETVVQFYILAGFRIGKSPLKPSFSKLWDMAPGDFRMFYRKWKWCWRFWTLEWCFLEPNFSLGQAGGGITWRHIHTMCANMFLFSAIPFFFNKYWKQAPVEIVVIAVSDVALLRGSQ